MTKRPPQKADQYRYDDGTVEVVFAVEDGRVLTFREYPDTDSFQAAVGDGEFDGVHPGVEKLPGVEAFRDGDPAEDGEFANDDG
jgi:hypothetical protein